MQTSTSRSLTWLAFSLFAAACSGSHSPPPSVELYLPGEGPSPVAILAEFRIGLSATGFFSAPEITDVVTSDNLEVLSIGSPGVSAPILLKAIDVGPASVRVEVESDDVRLSDELTFDVVSATLVPDPGACFGATILTGGRYGFRYLLQSDGFGVLGDAANSLRATDEHGADLSIDFHKDVPEASFDVTGNRVDLAAMEYNFAETLDFVRADVVTRFEVADVDSHVSDTCFECDETHLVTQTNASFVFHSDADELCVPVPDPFPAAGEDTKQFVHATLVSGECHAAHNGAAGLAFTNESETDCLFSVAMPDRPDLGELEVVVPAPS